ncbi:unnamed protein product [Choristocarpus tenellus]
MLPVNSFVSSTIVGEVEGCVIPAAPRRSLFESVPLTLRVERNTTPKNVLAVEEHSLIQPRELVRGVLVPQCLGKTSNSYSKRPIPTPGYFVAHALCSRRLTSTSG